MMREVVVSGLGLLTPSGLTAAESFRTWMQGRSAVGRAPAAILRWLPDALAATLPEGWQSGLSRADQGLDPSVQMGLVAATEAMADARWSGQDIAAERCGVYVGIGLAGAASLENLFSTFYQRVYEPEAQGHRNPTVMHPLTVPRLMSNATAAALSIRYQFQGPSYTSSVACASSAVALGQAWQALRSGEVDAALVVGTEAQICAGSFLAWNALRVMAKPDAQDVSRSCKPFDAERSGFVLGEGAGALLLESRASAQARGATIYGSIEGYACTSDAQHMTAPSLNGQTRAMRLALAAAQIGPELIDHINAHGTATDVGDAAEAQSIHAVFGERAARIPVSATKSMHGHLIGAGGAVEMACLMMSLQQQCVPPTASLSQRDPACKLDVFAGAGRTSVAMEYAMSNSFAFGGTNVALVARRFST